MKLSNILAYFCIFSVGVLLMGFLKGDKNN